MEKINKTTIHLTAHFNRLLTEIINVRKDKHLPVKTKQGIVEQNIEKLHKKEVGK
jgi:hypothetical protein